MRDGGGELVDGSLTADIIRTQVAFGNNEVLVGEAAKNQAVPSMPNAREPSCR